MPLILWRFGMDKYTFRVVRVVENDAVEIEASSDAEAFVKLVNGWQDHSVVPFGGNAVIREYIAFDDGASATLKMFADVDWDSCELDRETCEPELYSRRLFASKLGKYRCPDFTLWDLRRAFSKYKDRTSWRGLDAETAIESFIRFAGNEL